MMSIFLNVRVGTENFEVNIERPELIYGIEGLLFNLETSEKEACILKLNKKVPIIKSNELRFFIPAHIQKDFEYAKKNNMKIQQVIAPYFYGEGNERVKQDKPTQKRSSVIAVIKHNMEDKYLCLDCKNRICKSFVMGGIEEGENAEEAAIREIREETGYSNVKINYKSPFKLVNHFYADYKGVNRYALLDIVFGELNTEENVGISNEENDKHIVKWVSKEELRNFISVNNNKYILDILFDGEKAFEDKGIMINSKEWNDITSEEASYKINEYINE